MIEFLLARALARLPEPLRARYEAEWRADLAVLRARRLATLRWALGLPRAAADLRAQAGHGRRASVPRLALDALALGLAYYAAYGLRFDADVPARYQDLLVRTLPFAVVGGLLCLGLTGNYARAGAGGIRIIKGVALATLAIVAYAATAQPTLVMSEHGLTVLNVPAGVSVTFALLASPVLALNRALLGRRRPGSL
jgi:hypothetical protein